VAGARARPRPRSQAPARIDAYTLPGEAVGPEGSTEDPDGVTFYVPSYHKGTVFRGRIDRTETEV
jgi:hypothetical protein